MAYKVYLVEPLDVDNWIELDCENVDFTTIFSVADVSDISTRKASSTKQVVFKGTPTNNEAFGSMFFLNKTSNFGLDNRLFFNYNPLRTVDCLIYEDNNLLFRGSLRITGFKIDKFGNIIYETIIGDSVIDFRDILANKYLSDLDFSNLQHHYTWSNIQDSWQTRIEKYSAASNGYTYFPFQKGSGYVYPLIDYGVIFKKTDANTDVNKVNILNFRPAVYVKEYFNKIFSQPELSGYTFEIKGSPTVVDKFNSLIIPSNTETLTSKSSTFGVHAFSNGVQSHDVNKTEYKGDKQYRPINIQNKQDPALIVDWYGTYVNNTAAVFLVNRRFTSGGYCKIHIDDMYNWLRTPVRVTLQLVERDFVASSSGDFNSSDSWNVIASQFLRIPGRSGISNKDIEFEFGERTFEATSQLMLRIMWDENFFAPEGILGWNVWYNISDAHIKIPKDTGSVITYDVADGDVITPVPVDGIKQMDFMMSIVKLFNFYVYAEKERPKHLIFQNYDDYYALTQPQVLVSNANDWTSKIDFNTTIDGDTNVKLPKSYSFTLKEDSDFMNSTYKKNYNEVYGTFKFNDSYGLVDEKKVEVIFSPSPLVQYLNTQRVIPSIYTVDNNNKKPTKSNIRILYYNGIKSCIPYAVGKDVVSSASYDFSSIVSGVTTYAQAGNYYLMSGTTNMTPIDDLYFGTPKEMYFNFSNDHQSCPTAYQYYIGQVSDITNPDVIYIQCQVYLNEVDISNLNLRTPVFVDMGEFGHSYFKVLSIEYENNNTTSRCLLQKISI